MVSEQKCFATITHKKRFWYFRLHVNLYNTCVSSQVHFATDKHERKAYQKKIAASKVSRGKKQPTKYSSFGGHPNLPYAPAPQKYTQSVHSGGYPSYSPPAASGPSGAQQNVVVPGDKSQNVCAAPINYMHPTNQAATSVPLAPYMDWQSQYSQASPQILNPPTQNMTHHVQNQCTQSSFPSLGQTNVPLLAQGQFIPDAYHQNKLDPNQGVGASFHNSTYAGAQLQPTAGVCTDSNTSPVGTSVNAVPFTTTDFQKTGFSTAQNQSTQSMNQPQMAGINTYSTLNSKAKAFTPSNFQTPQVIAAPTPQNVKVPIGYIVGQHSDFYGNGQPDVVAPQSSAVQHSTSAVVSFVFELFIV